MLYEVITAMAAEHIRQSAGFFKEEAANLKTEAGKTAFNNTARWSALEVREYSLTSYHVCYTKLLRHRATVGVDDRDVRGARLGLVGLRGERNRSPAWGAGLGDLV